ncbi:MAG: hypothetical protein GAK30_03827 [Paracidovorax wautersii]|uniref:fumarylacetoacetase n=1 Tax=Paracidovorax wautersii TaxID=1177982 RepID=A0A7V8FKI1_9BURK|nr:MAG: hypothetical protein GAK30_03827 [Paracidovorax wautersii]
MKIAIDSLDRSHDPDRRSWVASANVTGCDFPLQNLPLGVFSHTSGGDSPRAGVAIGDCILDLSVALDAGLLPADAADAARAVSHADGSLNALMAQGHSASQALRMAVSELLGSEDTPNSEAARAVAGSLLVAQADARMHLPAHIGGFTDFMCSIEHVRRARGKTHPDDPVPASMRHMPLAYNSRASSVCPSGHGVVRPHGPSKAPDGTARFSPSEALDFELEIGAYIGPGSALGDAVALSEAQRQVFGLCLLNDWSARDIQRWESLPLGPFLGKSFATVVSPWVVIVQALAPFVCARAWHQADWLQPLPHLHVAAGSLDTFDLDLAVWMTSAEMRARGLDPLRITRSRFAELPWSLPQMVVHQASNGCDLRPGDLIGSGTVSGAGPMSCGCLAEFPAPLELPDGSTRRWLADGDELVLTAHARRDGFVPIGFGACRSRVLPSRPWPVA